MLDALRAAGGLDETPPLVRFLFAVRWKLNAPFGWDKPEEGVARRVASLRHGLPRDLRETSTGEEVPNTPFTAVYERHGEAAFGLANMTLHEVLHGGWVPADRENEERPPGELARDPSPRFGPQAARALEAPERA